LLSKESYKSENSSIESENEKFNNFSYPNFKQENEDLDKSKFSSAKECNSDQNFKSTTKNSLELHQESVLLYISNISENNS
jgi:hypothetical protein